MLHEQKGGHRKEAQSGLDNWGAKGNYAFRSYMQGQDYIYSFALPTCMHRRDYLAAVQRNSFMYVLRKGQGVHPLLAQHTYSEGCIVCTRCVCCADGSGIFPKCFWPL